ncbi:MAG: phosphatidate cytidylyltransferase [Betaproteobacteria bacterium]|nr:MAG: phosphatidate cytidylyltransferase [Betaproteobacteria bacterium]
MSATPLDPTFYLVTAIGGVLVLASLVGFGLKALVAGMRPHAGLDNLNARIQAWWILAALFGLALAGGTPGVCALFALASFMALREFAAPAAGAAGNRVLLRLALFVVLPLQYAFVWAGWHAAFALFIPAVALPLLAGAGAARGSRREVARLGAGLVICVYLVSHVPALMTLDVAGDGEHRVHRLVFLVLVVQGSDVLQYLWGKLAGRRRIAPRLSPSKTVAGTVGGILSATMLGALLAPITPFTVAQAARMAFILALLGFCGGLAMSALKRRRGIKDWGSAIRGHGGVLDRIDSLCLSAPAYFYLLWLGWMP